MIIDNIYCYFKLICINQGLYARRGEYGRMCKCAKANFKDYEKKYGYFHFNFDKP